MNVTLVLRTTQTALSYCRNLNCWTAAITKKHRKIYKLTYPTYLILSDGSSINIDFDIPKKIIRLPLDINTLSKSQYQMRLELRKPIKKVEVFEEYDNDSFDEKEFYFIKN